MSNPNVQLKYFIVAGEASGDLHGSNLIKQLQQLDKTCQIQFWGGDLMAALAGPPLKHIKDLAFMGFVEVVANIRTIFKNIEKCKQDILDFKPNVLVLVDYPGFNLRIAEFAHANGIKVVYYVSPQIWAWKQSRVHKIKKVVDRMLVILPFEKDFYSKFGVSVDFVGHPLLDAIETVGVVGELKAVDHSTSVAPHLNKNFIALLPGSRKQEISRMLPVMLEVAQKHPQYKFAIAAAPAIDLSYYKEFIQASGMPHIELIQGKTYDLLQMADAALVTSGTATLETALFRVPEVVCYKGGQVSYWIARSLVKVKFISLVNLIMDREVVCELIQDDFNAKRLGEELDKIMDVEVRKRLQVDYQDLSKRLGGGGASLRAAEIVYAEAQMDND